MLHLIKIRKQLKNELNLNKNFTRSEKRYIKIWVKTYKYNIDTILFCSSIFGKSNSIFFKSFIGTLATGEPTINFE